MKKKKADHASESMRFSVCLFVLCYLLIICNDNTFIRHPDIDLIGSIIFHYIFICQIACTNPFQGLLHKNVRKYQRAIHTE